MQAVEFETLLKKGAKSIALPRSAAARLPQTAKARVIVLFDSDAVPADDAAWRLASYEQFMKEDSDEDSVYDRFA